MNKDAFYLAQVNIGLPLEPVGAPRLADFVAALVPINALADATPGFVWRLQTEDGDATAIRPFDDARLMINMSTWESIEALGDYVYRSAHTEVMRQRREWFHHMQVYLALWWVPAGHRPTVTEARSGCGTWRSTGRRRSRSHSSRCFHRRVLLRGSRRGTMICARREAPSPTPPLKGRGSYSVLALRG